MALYKHANYLTQTTDASFDAEHRPGHQCPHSGIYRCLGCGREAACNHPDPLPPQNHHQHSHAQGSICWKIIVWADHNPK
jgi:hypothetical protein